jgi:hypothetical protein
VWAITLEPRSGYVLACELLALIERRTPWLRVRYAF